MEIYFLTPPEICSLHFYFISYSYAGPHKRRKKSCHQTAKKRAAETCLIEDHDTDAKSVDLIFVTPAMNGFT